MVFLLPQLVDRAAERFPEREAVRIHNQGLSYAELATQSSQLARVLLEEGVKRGDRVGIYMNKSLACAIAIYGIMKAGAAYVPLDPAAPLSRLSYVIRDCGIRHLVSQAQKSGHLLSRLANTQAGNLLECVIGMTDQTKQGIKAPCRTISWQQVYQTPVSGTLDVGTTEQDLAYILYTSGSTGDPKGIMHTHRSGLSFAQWAASTYGLHHEDRVSNHAPLHFDLSTFDFFATGLAGATTVMIPEAYKKLPASLSKLMADERLTVWYSVPFALTQLLLRGGLQARDLSALRWVLFAGEAFPTKYLRQLMAQLPHARFSNLYGPTETNVCTYYHVPPLSDQSGESDEPLPIGQVCENAQALVVDENDQPVKPGEIGELLIQGPLVMRGYWGRPDLDEQAFYQPPVFADDKDRFYAKRKNSHRRLGPHPPNPPLPIMGEGENDGLAPPLPYPREGAGGEGRFSRGVTGMPARLTFSVWRFYRTGDLVQQVGVTASRSAVSTHQPAGYFKFLGRKDRQIKTRGYRVELDEIEVALLSHKKVEEAAVFTLPDGQGTQHIEAVVTRKQEASLRESTSALSSSELRKHLSSSLPWYAVPAKIKIVERLPRTSTGKIDRRELQKQAIKKQ